jgi:hypothetical protein
MFEGANRSDMRELGLVMVRHIQEVLSRLKEKLEERDEHDRQVVKDLLDDLGWPLSRLEAFYSGDGDSGLEPRSANIFVHYCRDKLESLRELARIIDDEYSEAHPAEGQRVQADETPGDTVAPGDAS